jgi:hypothetical protein
MSCLTNTRRPDRYSRRRVSRICRQGQRRFDPIIRHELLHACQVCGMPDGWRLEVAGSISENAPWTIAARRTLPQVEQYSTSIDMASALHPQTILLETAAGTEHANSYRN